MNCESSVYTSCLCVTTVAYHHQCYIRNIAMQSDLYKYSIGVIFIRILLGIFGSQYSLCSTYHCHKMIWDLKGSLRRIKEISGGNVKRWLMGYSCHRITHRNGLSNFIVSYKIDRKPVFMTRYIPKLQPLGKCRFLPEASIGLRVLSLPASVRPSVSPSVRHQVCPRDNSSPVQARITKFGP